MSLLNQALPNAKQLREAKGFGEVTEYHWDNIGLPLQKRLNSRTMVISNKTGTVKGDKLIPPPAFYASSP